MTARSDSQHKKMTEYVIAAVDDMLFVSKIRAVAEHLGLRIKFARSADQVLEAARAEQPSLIIVDLHSQKISPLALATHLKSDAQLRSIMLLGFFSHVETETKRQAEEAGFDKVIPRSLFAKDLAAILTQHNPEQ